MACAICTTYSQLLQVICQYHLPSYTNNTTQHYTTPDHTTLYTSPYLNSNTPFYSFLSSGNSIGLSSTRTKDESTPVSACFTFQQAAYNALVGIKFWFTEERHRLLLIDEATDTALEDMVAILEACNNYMLYTRGNEGENENERADKTSQNATKCELRCVAK